MDEHARRHGQVAGHSSRLARPLPDHDAHQGYSVLRVVYICKLSPGKL